MSQTTKETARAYGDNRKEARNVATELVELTNLEKSWSAETTRTHNLSSSGARVVTQRLWEPGSLLLLKSLRSNFWAHARVVYWRGFYSRAVIGLEFISQSGDWQQQSN